MWKKLLGQAVDYAKDKASDAVDWAKDSASKAVSGAVDWVEDRAASAVAGAADRVREQIPGVSGTGGGQVPATSTEKTATETPAVGGQSGGFSYSPFTYRDYAESETVRQAKAALDAQLNAKPGEYSSKWQEQIDDMLARIAGREDFSYDVNADALYQQYKDQYLQAGRMAMADTMGQAAAMTGGYGNSYAASAGNQAYQGYLSQLTAMIPELEGRAYDRYLREGQEMQDLYAMYRDREDQDYGRYRDSVADFERERDYLTGRYDTERDLDYGRYADERAFAYGQYADDRNLAYTDYRNQIADSQWRESFEYGKERDAVADSQWRESFDYGKAQDAIANQQWQQSFDEGVRQYDESMTYQKEQDKQDYYQWVKEFQEGQRQYNNSLAASNEHWNAEFAFMQEQYEDAKASGDETTALQHVASLSSEDLVAILADYRETEDMEGLATFLDDCVAVGRMTPEMADEYYERYQLTTHPGLNVFVPPENGSSGYETGSVHKNSGQKPTPEVPVTFTGESPSHTGDPSLDKSWVADPTAADKSLWVSPLSDDDAWMKLFF